VTVLEVQPRVGPRVRLLGADRAHADRRVELRGVGADVDGHQREWLGRRHSPVALDGRRDLVRLLDGVLDAADAPGLDAQPPTRHPEIAVDPRDGFATGGQQPEPEPEQERHQEHRERDAHHREQAAAPVVTKLYAREPHERTQTSHGSTSGPSRLATSR
jgi:hypothetical protein